MTVATIGDRLNLVGISGEVFCSHALSLRRRARDQELMFFGCCNDYQQYFPTIEASAEGGYGTVAPIAVAEPGAGERMTDRALIHLLRRAASCRLVQPTERIRPVVQFHRSTRQS